MTTTLNPVAVSSADLLRAVRDGGWATRTELAESVGRKPNNISRDLGVLEKAGLIAIDPDATAPRPLTLTAEGEAQLAAIGRAEHGGEKRKPRGRWPIEKIVRNPKNRAIDPETVLDLADTIVTAEDVLQPIILTPPDAHGVRMLKDGERRWLATTILAGEGRLPAALQEGIRFIEREASETIAADDTEAADTLLVMLITASQREGLTPFEDAKALWALHQATGWNASEITRRIGRSRADAKGREMGQRDVQAKIKIMREATAEAIAAYEADPAAPGAWETLRRSVEQRQDIVTTKVQRLALAELWHKADRAVDVDVGILPAAWAAGGDRLHQYGLAVLTRSERGDTARVTEAGRAYLEAEGLTGNLQQAHHDLRFIDAFRADRFTTAWLNTPGWPNRGRPGPETAALQGIEAISADEPAPGETFKTPFAAEQGWVEPLITLQAWTNAKGDTGWSWKVVDQRGWDTRDPVEYLANAALAKTRMLSALRARHGSHLPVPAHMWLDSQQGPHVVNGQDCYNAARAGEMRRSLGWEKRHSNSGGGKPASGGADYATRDKRIEAELDKLSNADLLQLVELADKILRHPDPGFGDRHTQVSGDGPLGMRARLAELGGGQAYHDGHNACGLYDIPMGWLTQEGWIDAIGAHPLRLKALRADVYGEAAAQGLGEGQYLTPWLNLIHPWMTDDQRAAAMAPEAEAAPAVAPTDIWGRDHNTAVAERATLLRVEDFVQGLAGDPTSDYPHQLLAAVGISGPFGYVGDGLSGVVEGRLQPCELDALEAGLTPERKRAFWALAAWALNRTFGPERGA